MDRMLCICGPTASGKTALAVALAKEYDGEIVSCDSMQIYRGMDVGTAKPTPAEMGGVRHWLLDVADPGEDFSVGRYVTLADAAVRDILDRGKLPIVVGGTGLYMDSLILGREFAPVPSTGQRQLLERAAEEKGIEFLFDLLKTVDPETAERLHLSDRKRILRALEVFYETGLPISWHNAETRKKPPRWDPVWLGLTCRDRTVLYRRIDARVEQMTADGLAQEVRALLARGLDPKTTAMQAIGYKEMAAAIRGECTVPEAVAAIQQASRRYAKRQLTWFRRNDKIRWIAVDACDPLTEARKILSRAFPST